MREPAVANPGGREFSLPENSFRIGLSLAGLCVLLILWSVGVRLLQQNIPLAAMLAPGDAFRSLYELTTSNELTTDTLVSLRRVLVSLFAALALGVPIGIGIGVSNIANKMTGSAFQFLRMISPLSWMPIAVMVFGIGDAPIYFLLTITAIWPIIINTSAGVRQLNPQWLMLTRSLSATRWETLTRVVAPGILGHVLTGVRVAIGISWILLIPCEMLGVSSGLGYFILDTRDRMAYSELMAAIVLIGALGFLLDASVQKLHRLWVPGDED
ncbi:MAG TPA: ABC transporter permease [Marinobacter sp.]|nr:ABC transporter permease [Marinobacter sp.]